MSQLSKTSPKPRLELELIEAALTTYFVGQPKGFKNEIWDELDSTNNRAIELVREGAPEGLFVIARQQSAGRGRQGKTWLSQPNAGIYISFILRPAISQAELPLLSLLAGLAAAEAIEHACSLKIGLKWVNDLVYDGRKLGGILCEMPGQVNNAINTTAQILPAALILGIGINLDLKEADLSAELKGHVACLDQLCAKEVNANLLVAELCSSIESHYNSLRHGAAELIVEEWKKRSATLGKMIKATVAKQEVLGLAKDIAPNGALIVSLEDGKETQLHAGEISIRLEDGSYA